MGLGFIPGGLYKNFYGILGGGFGRLWEGRCGSGWDFLDMRSGAFWVGWGDGGIGEVQYALDFRMGRRGKVSIARARDWGEAVKAGTVEDAGWGRRGSGERV